MLRIRRSEGKGPAVFAFSGRVEKAHIPEIEKLFKEEAEGADITLDLEEVRLVDREAVRFLVTCKARGIKLKNCPSYIREWIETGGERNHES